MPGEGPQPSVEEYVTRLAPHNHLPRAPSEPARQLTEQELRLAAEHERAELAAAKATPAAFLAAMAAAGNPGTSQVNVLEQWMTLLGRIQNFLNVGYPRMASRTVPRFIGWPVFERRRLGDGRHRPYSERVHVVFSTGGRYFEVPETARTGSGSGFVVRADSEPVREGAPPTDAELLRVRSEMLRLASRHRVALS